MHRNERKLRRLRCANEQRRRSGAFVAAVFIDDFGDYQGKLGSPAPSHNVDECLGNE
jgi:hypothetical protein